jgi:hypothetical protein
MAGLRALHGPPPVESFLELPPAVSELLALPQILAGVEATCKRAQRLFGALHDTQALHI